MQAPAARGGARPDADRSPVPGAHGGSARRARPPPTRRGRVRGPLGERYAAAQAAYTADLDRRLADIAAVEQAARTFGATHQGAVCHPERPAGHRYRHVPPPKG